MLCFSGVFKAVSGIATELRVVSFTPVAQAAGRRVALEVFNHVLTCSFTYREELGRCKESSIEARGRYRWCFAMLYLRSFQHSWSWHCECFAAESVQLARRRGGIEYVLLLRLVDHAHDRGVREQEEVGDTMDGLSTGKAVDALLNYETVSISGT